MAHDTKVVLEDFKSTHIVIIIIVRRIYRDSFIKRFELGIILGRMMLSTFYSSVKIGMVTSNPQIGYYHPSISIKISLLTPFRLRGLILYMSIKLTPNDKILRRFLRQFCLLSGFLPGICWEEVAEDINSYFRFDVWPGVRILISQHPTF